MCTAAFSSFEKHLPQVHTLINEHLAQSFLYSIMVTRSIAHFGHALAGRIGPQNWSLDIYYECTPP